MLNPLKFKRNLWKMTGLCFVTAENKSVENSSKMLSGELWLLPSDLAMWRKARMRSAEFYCSGQPVLPPTPQVTAQFRSKIWPSIFCNICWFVQGRNMKMIICIQNSNKYILNINWFWLWSSITEDMKLLFEFIYIYIIFTVKRKYKGIF